MINRTMDYSYMASRNEVDIEHRNDEEYQYLNLIRDIINKGTWEEGRNGRTKSIFGSMMRFSLKDGKIPILTTKKTAWKTCLKELLWFIRGETDSKLLQEQGVHIWDGNTTREFLDSRGLHLYPEGMIGPGYGYQWRNLAQVIIVSLVNPLTELNTHLMVLINYSKLLMLLKTQHSAQVAA